jgi:hypothetical protein
LAAAAVQYKSLYRRYIGILYPFLERGARQPPVKELGDVRFPFFWDTRTEWRLFRSRLASNSLHARRVPILRRSILDDSAFETSR